jgi:hypothetical protein
VTGALSQRGIAVFQSCSFLNGEKGQSPACRPSSTPEGNQKPTPLSGDVGLVREAFQEIRVFYPRLLPPVPPAPPEYWPPLVPSRGRSPLPLPDCWPECWPPCWPDCCDPLPEPECCDPLPPLPLRCCCWFISSVRPPCSECWPEPLCCVMSRSLRDPLLEPVPCEPCPCVPWLLAIDLLPLPRAAHLAHT